MWMPIRLAHTISFPLMHSGPLSTLVISDLPRHSIIRFRLPTTRSADSEKSTSILNPSPALAPYGDKVQQGDGKTPEGMFTITRRNPNSKYHLSLGIDYPQADDIARARATGVDPGGDIFIHGQPNGFGKLATIPTDWTAGCIAVSDAEIEELWRVVQTGTTVEIRR